MLRRTLTLLVLAAAAVVGLAAPAWAHVQIEPEEAVAGSTETLTFTVRYEGAATTGPVVQLPTAPGAVLFPAIQQTTAGEEAWIDEEQAIAEDVHPAPRLTLVAEPNGSSTTTEATTSEATATTESDLPGTTLEAEERDDGATSAAPWIIGSGIAALVAVVVGGTILKRRAG